MKPQILNVKPLPNYKIYLNFEDGVEGEVSLKHLVNKGVFKWWNEGDNFFRVYIDSETKAIAWNDDLDIDTFNLYLQLKGIDFEQWQHQNQSSHATN
jgi:Protein of unknown function (DUF2442)